MRAAPIAADEQTRSCRRAVRIWRRDRRRLAPILLVLGDEELLVTRAVTEAVAQARGADPGADVREYEAGALTAGELAEMLSPSLFGGRRVLVIRGGQDARKDLVAALLAYAKYPDPDVTLVVTHAGGAKGKAFADGLRDAGATSCRRRSSRGTATGSAFVRDEFRRLGGQVRRRRRRGAARRGRQRPARAGGGLLPADRRHRRPDRRRRRSPATTGAGPR